MKWMHMHTHTHTVTTAKHSCEVRRNVHNLTHLCGALIKPLIKMYIEPKWGITHTWTRTNTHLHRKRQRHSHTVKVVRGLTRKVHILVIFKVVWKTTSYLSVVSSGDAIKWKQCTPETQSEGDEEERCHSQHPTQRESQMALTGTQQLRQARSHCAGRRKHSNVTSYGAIEAKHRGGDSMALG